MLHVSTGGAHQGFDGMLSYCASKAALRSVYESLRDEYAGRVCFGSAQPGVVATEMMRGLVRRRCGTYFHVSSGRIRHSLVDPGTGRGHGRLLRDPRLFYRARRSDAGGGRHHRGTRRRAQQPGERRALLRVSPSRDERRRVRGEGLGHQGRGAPRPVGVRCNLYVYLVGFLPRRKAWPGHALEPAVPERGPVHQSTLRDDLLQRQGQVPRVLRAGLE